MEVLLVTKPFTVGDYIDTPSGEGTVREMSLTYTFLETMEGQRLAVPNSTLSSGKIINYSTLATRRLQHKITASYDDATADVRRACLTAVGRTANVLADPAPVVYVSSYGESSIEYIVRCWTKTEDYWPAYYQLLEESTHSSCFSCPAVVITVSSRSSAACSITGVRFHASISRCRAQTRSRTAKFVSGNCPQMASATSRSVCSATQR